MQFRNCDVCGGTTTTLSGRHTDKSVCRSYSAMKAADTRRENREAAAREADRINYDMSYAGSSDYDRDMED